MGETREKSKTYYDKNTVERKFKTIDQVLIVAISKPNKLSVNWIGPGVIESQLSETNYIVKLLGKGDRSQIFHVNLLKPYYHRAELINVLISEKVDKTLEEVDLDISYPNANPDVYDFVEIIRNNKLAERCTETQIEQFRNVLDRHKKVFSNDLSRTSLIEHDIELISETL